jgi:hypothetical protein
MASLLHRLPDDLLLYIFSFLPAQALARLSRTDRVLYAFVTAQGWPLYVRRCLSLDPVTVTPSNLLNPVPFSSRPAVSKARFGVQVDRAWRRNDFRSIQLGPQWRQRCLPVLKLDRQVGRVLVGVGPQLRIHDFDSRGVLLYPSDPPTLSFGRSQADDLTGIATVQDAPDHYIVSHVSGLIQQIALDQYSPQGFVPLARYQNPSSPSRRPVHTIHSSNNLLASLSYPSTLVIHRIRSPWLPPLATLDLPTRAWSVLLSPHQHWIAIGHVGDRPLSVYPLEHIANGNSPSSDRSSSSLPSPRKLGGNRRRTAVYALTSPPPSSPLFGSASTLIAGCFDSAVRIFDLRTPPRPLSSSSCSSTDSSDSLDLGTFNNHRRFPPVSGFPSSTSRPAATAAQHTSSVQQPVLTLEDRWSEEAVYSVACGGGGGTSIAAGVARHGVVRLWDVRKASESRDEGVSVFSHGRDSSPVYSLAMVRFSSDYCLFVPRFDYSNFASNNQEHSRLFGATEQRAWMLDFDPSSEWLQGRGRRLKYYSHSKAESQLLHEAGSS